MANSSGTTVRGRRIRLVLGVGVGAVALALGFAHMLDLHRAGASMQTITLSGPDTLGRGLQDVYTVVLSDPAPGPDGLQITFAAADSTSCVIADSEFGIGQSPKTLTVSAGARRRTLVLQSLAGGTGACSVSVTSTTPSGWTATPSPLNVSIVQAQLRIRELVHSVSNLAATQPFFVEIGVPAGAGRRLKFVQGLSAGSPNLTVTACSDQPSIATVVNRFGQDVPPPGCEDNPIMAPYSRTVPGDFGLDPIAGQSGTVTVSVAASGTIGDQRSVAVRGSSVTLAGAELLGAGLQDTYSATLSDAALADQAVTISVADATRCVVGATEQSLGTSSVSVTIPAGRYRAEFIVQGVAAPILPDTTPCTVTASAGTFGTDSIDIDVVQPGLRIRELASSMSSFASNDPFFIELGVPGANGRLRFVQELRAGSAPTANTPLPVTVQSDAPAVGTIVNVNGVDVGNDGQETDYVQIGFSRTVPGNLQFDPISGSTTPVGVTATAPGFISMEQDVTVQAVSLGIAGPKLLGSGLQDDYTVQLFNAAGHPATLVTVSSLNPAACMVSLTANAQPSASITVNVAADDGNAPFVVQAVADLAPTDCPLQAVATGYTTATLTPQVVQPGIQIRQLGRNIPSDANNDNFFVEVGVPNTNNTQLQTVQRLTVGPAGDQSIKVCSSHPDIGTIVKQGVDNPPAVDDPAGQGCEDDTIRQAFSQNVPGNLQFDPKAPGFTLVQVSATGFATMNRTGRIEIRVGGAAIRLSLPNKVGANLQESAGFRLTQVAGGSGATVTITSITPGICGVALDAGSASAASIQVAVPAGGDNASFEVAGLAVGTCQLTATATGYFEDDQDFDVVEPALAIIGLDSTTGTTAPDASFTVQIGVPAGGGRVTAQAVRIAGTAVPVTICSSNTGVGTIVGAGGNGCATQSINPGQSAVTFTFHVVGVAGSTKITVNGGGGMDSETVHVAQTVVNLRGGTDLLGKNLQATFFAVANNNGGVTVTLHAQPSSICVISLDPAVAGNGTDQTVTIPAGATRASFVLQALDVGACTITASGTGFPPATRKVQIDYTRLRISGLASTMGFLAPNDSFFVEIGPRNSNIADVQTNHDNRYGITQAQSRRAGAAGLPVSVCSSNSAVAQLNTGGADSACISTTITAGASQTPDLQFDPLTGGTTDVTASSTEYGVDDTKFTVTVKPGAVTLDSPDTIGNYLEASAGAVFSPPPPSGTTVAVTASGACVVSSTPGGCPSSSLTLAVATGRSRADFWIQGIAVGTCTITLSSNLAGFNPQSVDLPVVTPAARIRGLDASESTAAKNDPFFVDIGVASNNLKTIRLVQPVRPSCAGYLLPVTDGIAGFPLRVCSSNTAVGTVVNGVADGANCSRKVIPPLQSQTPAPGTSGAYQFDPLTAGTTVVYVDQAGSPPVPITPITAGSVTVTVVADTIGITPSKDIGVGLQDDYQVVLSRAAGADGNVTVTSQTPAVCLVAAVAAGPFAMTANLSIPSGHTRADFMVQALTSGDCILHPTITVTGQSYTPVDRTLQAVGYAARIINLDATRSTQSPNDPFNVEVGVANDNLTGLAQVQDVRTGGGALPLTVCVSNPANPPQVAVLVGQDANGCVHVSIPEGQHRTADGALVLDVLNAGTATVCTSTQVSIRGTCVDVQVAADVANIHGPDPLGAGLQEQYTVALTNAVQSDTTFTVTNNTGSFDASGICKVALTSTGAGANSISVVVSKGRSSATFFVRGVDNVSGTCQLQASTASPGITAAYREIAVVPFSAEIINLDTTRATQSANDPFNVQIGVADSRLIGLSDVQAARADGAGIAVLTCVQNPPSIQVATLVGADVNGCVATTIPAGQSKTPDNALVLDVLNAGTVQVCTSSPTFVRNSCKEVVVAADVASIRGPDSIGAGLQDQYTLVLSAAVQAATTFTIATKTNSFDTSNLCTVATTATGAGAISISVTVPQNRTSVTFYLHALDGVSGTCKISASTATAGITAGYREVSVVPYAAEIINLDTTRSTQSANDPFNVDIGTASSGLVSVANEQVARSDGAGVLLTVCAINPPLPAATVGTIVGAGSNGCINVTIAAGQSRTATNALVLDVLNAGTVVICTTSPTEIQNSCRDVVVAADVATIGGPSQLGASLEDEYSLSLTTAVTSDTTFTIASATNAYDTSNLCKVSLNETDVGQTSITAVVPSGRSRINFWVHGMDGVTGTCQISASTTASGITSGFRDIPIVTPGLAISGLSGSLKTGSAADAFIVQTGIPSGNLNGLSVIQERRAGSASLTVTACSSSPTVAQIVSSSGTAACGTAPVTPNTSVTGASALAVSPLTGGPTTIVASAPGFITTNAASKDVTVSQSTISLTAASGQTAIGSGLQDTFNIQLSPSAPTGGLPVTVTSLTPSLCRVAADESTAGGTTYPVTIAKGHSLQHYAIQALENVTGLCSVTVTSTNTAYTGDQFDIAIVQPAVRIRALDPTTTVASANDPFNVDVGVPRDNLTDLRIVQTVRAGAPTPVTVTACSSNTGIGTILGTATSDPACKSATVTAGNSATANNALQFHPAGSGPTTVIASAPGYITTDAGSVDVFVASAALSFAHSTITQVGAGLMDTFTVKSSTSVGANTVVTITSLTPSICQVAISESTVAAAAVGVTITAGHSSTTFAIHGLENVQGTCSLQAATAGFSNGFGTYDIVNGALRISSLSTGKTVGANDDAFNVDVGITNASLTNLQATQKVRTGSAGLVVTVCSSDPVVGSIVGPPAGTGCATATIAAGSSTNNSLKFHTGTGGTTTGSATAPNFITTDAGTVDITVNGAGASLAIKSTNTRVGAGLQDGTFYVQAGAAPASAVTVTVTSLTPSLCVVSSSGAVVGGSSATVTIPTSGSASNSFWVQGLEGVIGTCSLKASANFYPDGSGSADIVTAAIRISNLATAIAATAANDPFNVDIGVPATDLSDVATVQQVRAGSSGFTITLANTSAPTAQLTSSTPPSPAQTVTVVIAAQSSTTTDPNLQFDPLAAGGTSVTASNPNATATTAATLAVAVTSGGGC